MLMAMEKNILNSLVVDVIIDDVRKNSALLNKELTF